MKDLRTYIKTIPEKPGIYKYFSKEGKIIYVGKAKNLKKRVHSYFQKTFENNKTAVLVKQITKIEYLVVDTELDALLLENNLIKQYRPKYNILLKDDKTFPWIGIKNEAFPRVISTRKKENDGTQYFGPYANVKMMNTLLKLIKETYPLRSCNFDLRPKNIQENKFKVCLDYHIGKCKGPCVGYQSEENYLDSIHQITLLLKGKTNALLQELKHKMQESSKELAFEKAQEYKEIYEQLLQYKSKSMVVSNHVLDLDVMAFNTARLVLSGTASRLIVALFSVLLMTAEDFQSLAWIGNCMTYSSGNLIFFSATNLASLALRWATRLPGPLANIS